jgi:hypothetical protein
MRDHTLQIVYFVLNEKPVQPRDICSGFQKSDHVAGGIEPVGDELEVYQGKDVNRKSAGQEFRNMVGGVIRIGLVSQNDDSEDVGISCLAGSVSFRGNDRSPDDRAVDIGKSAAELLRDVLPDVFDRFKEAAARSADVRKGMDALFTAENLQGLPSVFGSLGLLRDERGKTVFRVENGPLTEVLSRIEERANYGDTASGRFLSDELAKEPFGWDFEAVRLLVLSLLRAGKIQATSKGQTIDSATGIEARDTFSNSNIFRQASFHPKKGVEFDELVRASEAFRDTFGSEVRELNAGAIVSELRKEIARHEDAVASAHGQLIAYRPSGRHRS